MVSSRDQHAAYTIPPTLPPSVEEAYKKKCFELRRRMNEVEEANDACRLRLVRHRRAIAKVRLERAILLDVLAQRMQKAGVDADGGFSSDTEGSSEAPPTPEEKPLRSKRPHRRTGVSSPPPLGQFTAPTPSQSQASASFTTPLAPQPTFPHTNGTSSLPALPQQSLSSHPFHPPAPVPLSQPMTDRPKPPSDMFTDYMLHDWYPRQHSADLPSGDLKPWIAAQWTALPDAERYAWERRYEEEMTEWTKVQDERKRMARVTGKREGRRARSSRGAEAEVEVEEGKDVEMGGQDEEEGAQGGFTAVNG